MDRSGGGEVVVVGAGILGCSIAVHLVDRGVRPVLIDPERPGQGTSTGSFASISAFGKDPVAWFQLACAGMSGWTRFAERLGGEVGLRRGGEVRFTSDPEAGRRLARLVAGSRERGYPVRPVDRAELGRLLPDARIGPVAAACFAPNDGQVEPPLVLAACRAELEGPGCGSWVAGPGSSSTTTGCGSRSAPRCCGPGPACWPPAPRPCRWRPRSAWRSRPSPARACWSRPGRCRRSPTGSSTCPGGPGPAVHLRQRADGSVLIGERTQETPATDPGLGHARALAAQAARFFPVLAGVRVDRWWLAYRAMPADGLPIVGPLPWLEGLYVAVSHSGVTVAPVLGRLVAGEVAEQMADGLLAPFRPARFAERATRLLLEVESVFRDPLRQDRST